MPRLYEFYATATRPVNPLKCCVVVYQQGEPPKQCSFWIREIIDGHGYCYRHAKELRP